MSSRSRATALFVIAFVLFTAAVTWGQAGSKNGPRYDTSKEVTIKGEVQEVRQLSADQNVTQLVVKSGDKTVLVYLAPAEFLKDIDCWIKAGDQVEVVGSKTPDADQEQILAREVTFGNNTMTLRDPKGIPIWSNWKPAKTS